MNAVQTVTSTQFIAVAVSQTSENNGLHSISFGAVMQTATTMRKTDGKNVAASEKPQSPASEEPQDSTLQTDKQTTSANGTTATETEQVNGIENAASSENDTELKGNEDITELFESMMLCLQQLLQKLQEITGVSENELQQAFTELNLQPEALFDKDTLQAVVLKLNDSDIGSLLTDETVSGQMQALLNELSNALEQNGLMSEVASDEMLMQNFITKWNELMQNPVQEETFGIKEQVIKFFSGNNEPANTVTSGSETEQNSFIANPADVTTGDAKSGRDFSHEDGNAAKDRDDSGQVNAFLQNLAMTRVNSTDDAMAKLHAFDEVYHITEQILEQIRIVVSPTQTSMEMQLNPENLGHVSLQISSKDGVMSAQLTTQNQMSKEVLESQMQVLRETLEQQGLKVANIEVTVSEFGFRQNEEAASQQQKQQSHQSGRGTNHNDSDDDFVSNAREASEIRMEMNGNSVDFVA